MQVSEVYNRFNCTAFTLLGLCDLLDTAELASFFYRRTFVKRNGYLCLVKAEECLMHVKYEVSMQWWEAFLW
jgi:hypothetical protein